MDFLLADGRAVECFGDYWHCNPELYASTWYNGSLHATAAERWARDARRLQSLAQQGIAALVLWEHDIRHQPDQALARLRDFMESARATH